MQSVGENWNLGYSVKPSSGFQLRSGERMKPTAQAVGKIAYGQAPAGAKE